MANEYIQPMNDLDEDDHLIGQPTKIGKVTPHKKKTESPSTLTKAIRHHNARRRIAKRRKSR